MMDIDKLPLVLDELGHTANMIRDTLVKLDIKGSTARSRHCPVAKYLAYRGFDFPSVSLDGISIVGVDGKLAQIRPEDPVRDFIHNFDAGMYPELLSESARLSTYALYGYNAMNSGGYIPLNSGV